MFSNKLNSNYNISIEQALKNPKYATLSLREVLENIKLKLKNANPSSDAANFIAFINELSVICSNLKNNKDKIKLHRLNSVEFEFFYDLIDECDYQIKKSNLGLDGFQDRNIRTVLALNLLMPIFPVENTEQFLIRFFADYNSVVINDFFTILAIPASNSTLCINILDTLHNLTNDSNSTYSNNKNSNHYKQLLINYVAKLLNCESHYFKDFDDQYISDIVKFIVNCYQDPKKLDEIKAILADKTSSIQHKVQFILYGYFALQHDMPLEAYQSASALTETATPGVEKSSKEELVLLEKDANKSTSTITEVVNDKDQLATTRIVAVKDKEEVQPQTLTTINYAEQPNLTPGIEAVQDKIEFDAIENEGLKTSAEIKSTKKTITRSGFDITSFKQKLDVALNVFAQDSDLNVIKRTKKVIAHIELYKYLFNSTDSNNKVDVVLTSIIEFLNDYFKQIIDPINPNTDEQKHGQLTELGRCKVAILQTLFQHIRAFMKDNTNSITIEYVNGIIDLDNNHLCNYNIELLTIDNPFRIFANKKEVSNPEDHHSRYSYDIPGNK